MKAFLFILSAVWLLSACQSQSPSQQPLELSSPDGHVRVSVSLGAEGEPTYRVFYRDQSIMEPSALGMNLSDGEFSRQLTLEKVFAPTVVEEQYRLSHGKQLRVDYTANERRIRFVNAQGDLMDVVFRAANDGIAFRYHFPGESEQVTGVIRETTSFRFAESTKAWLQPMQVVKTGFEGTNPAYEEHYEMEIPVGTPSPSQAGWVFPALFQTGETWVLLSEVGMQSNFHASRLKAESPNGEYVIDGPMEGEVFAGGRLMANDTRPFSSPWRTITVGSLEKITASHMGTDLAEPAIDMDQSFIEPGIASWSWGLLKDDSITYDIQKQFIDYAADMGWEYSLVDVNWDRTIGYERMQELVDYAEEKQVGLFLWYNSSGDWNTTTYSPKSRLVNREDRREEFARLQEMGVRGVKIDFFPGDGQSSMAYYRDILEDAADFHLMVNHHGSTLPRGIHRTYPHMMTMESVHGMEMVTFGQGSADLEASHVAMLPFARNVFDPMDYTPTVFDTLRNPSVQRKTRNGLQLALPVVFLSGIEHIVETPEGMDTVPEYVRDFMSNVPVAWDESRLVEGYPGKYAVFARRSGSAWYIAGINGTASEQTLTLHLSFLNDRNGTMITDGPEPRSFVRRDVTASDRVEVTMQPTGGFVITYH